MRRPLTLLLLLTVVWLGACASPLIDSRGAARFAIIRSQREPDMPTEAQSHTVVFIHGMYMTPACWEPWEDAFKARGYTTLAPPWPAHEEPVEVQRRSHPNRRLGALTLEDVLASYRAVIATLPEKPILIGHSMGGLIVQILLQEGLATAGVAIDSAPPKGVISLKPSFLRANWPHIRPGAELSEPVSLTFEQFQYAFVNKLGPAEQRRAYDTQVVPESRRIGQAPTTDVARIDFSRQRPPLLMIAGSDDHIIPASLNRSNYGRYRKSPSVTDFREFPGRTHWIIAEPGWQEVAAYAAEWLSASP